MNRYPFPSRSVAATVLGLLALVASASSTLASVTVDADLSNPVLLAGDRQSVYLRVALTGQQRADSSRTPVNVAIVLDRSGSMQGQKIRAAREAAIAAVDRLLPDDIVSVVTYESTVQVLVPATKVSDRERIHAGIERITAGGSTALFAGVSKGAAELRKFFDRNRVNRVILLSDGIANVGPSSPGDLGDLGASLAREGIAVTTIGLGLGYNEDLMASLALRSDGNHFFVESSEDLRLAYATEFGDVLSVVAQDVTIEIRCPEGVRPVRVLGREASIHGQAIRASINQLYGEHTKYVLVELEVPAGRVGHVHTVAKVDARWADMRTRATQRASRTVATTFTDSPAAVERAIEREVMIAVAGQLAAERNELAVMLRDQGKTEEARRVFQSNALRLQQAGEALGDSQLIQDAKANTAATLDLEDDEAWKRSRKQQLEYQTKTKQQGRYAEPSNIDPLTGKSDGKSGEKQD